MYEIVKIIFLVILIAAGLFILVPAVLWTWTYAITHAAITVMQDLIKFKHKTINDGKEKT